MCEFCGNDKDIIFPFQLKKCQRCEGEPSLLVAGLGHSTAHHPRPSIPLTWRDWKISKPRRLARVLWRDRKEGEGGEEDLEPSVGQRVMSDEELDETAEEKQTRGGIFPATSGKLVKAFSWNKSNEEDQEVTGGTESEREEEAECEKGDVQHKKVYSKQRAMRKKRRDGHAKRDTVNLLKVLHMDRLKKSVSKEDIKESGSESRESQDEIGQEKRHRWKVSSLASLNMGFSKKEGEDGGKAGVTDEEEQSLEKVTGTQEAGSDDISDKGQTAETEESGAENVEKYSLLKIFELHQLPTFFSRARNKEDRSGESDEKTELVTENEKPSVTSQNNWRGRKTRKARRVTRGRKLREGTEKEESKTEEEESADMNDDDIEKVGEREYGKCTE